MSSVLGSFDSLWEALAAVPDHRRAAGKRCRREVGMERTEAFEEAIGSIQVARRSSATWRSGYALDEVLLLWLLAVLAGAESIADVMRPSGRRVEPFRRRAAASLPWRAGAGFALTERQPPSAGAASSMTNCSVEAEPRRGCRRPAMWYGADA